MGVTCETRNKPGGAGAAAGDPGVHVRRTRRDATLAWFYSRVCHAVTYKGRVGISELTDETPPDFSFFIFTVACNAKRVLTFKVQHCHKSQTDLQQ